MSNLGNVRMQTGRSPALKGIMFHDVPASMTPISESVQKLLDDTSMKVSEVIILYEGTSPPGGTYYRRYYRTKPEDPSQPEKGTG